MKVRGLVTCMHAPGCIERFIYLYTYNIYLYTYKWVNMRFIQQSDWSEVTTMVQVWHTYDVS